MSNRYLISINMNQNLSNSVKMCHVLQVVLNNEFAMIVARDSLQTSEGS